MSLHPAAWQRSGAPNMVVDWVTNGIRMPFLREPEPCQFDNSPFSEAESR